MPTPRRLPNEEGEYQCTICHKWHAMWEFHKDKNTANGRTSKCKPCRKKLDKRKKLKSRYGLTLQDFERKLAEQDNKCGCCGDEFEIDGKKSKAPCVDHDHKSQQVRDILCSRCNIALGHLKDCAKRAAKLLEYLNKWASRG